MQLVQRNEILIHKRKAYVYFEATDCSGNRDFSETEFTWLQKQNKRLQIMTDRVLGPDEGMIYTTDFTGRKDLILRVEDPLITSKVRSLIGWIELFSLESEEAHAEILNFAFPLGKPGFAP